MKSTMLAIIAAVFVALTLTGCTVDCEITSGETTCTYKGLSSGCCDLTKATEGSDATACNNDADKEALVKGVADCLADALANAR